MADIIEIGQFRRVRGPQGSPRQRARFKPLIDNVSIDDLRALLDQMNRERDLLLKGKGNNE